MRVDRSPVQASYLYAVLYTYDNVRDAPYLTHEFIRIIVSNHSHINMKPTREVHPPHYQRERHAVARCIRRKATSGMTIVAK